jgi:hypothetical protein
MPKLTACRSNNGAWSAEMIALAEPIDADVLRVRNEFLTRPDLHASADAVARLVDVTPRHAMVILDSLVHEEFLERTADGQYVHRQTDFKTCGVRL